MVKMDSSHIRIILYFFLVSQLGLLLPQVSGNSAANIKYVSALLNASFREFDQLKQFPVWNHITGEGKFGIGAAHRAAKGYLYYLPSTDWCNPIAAKVPEVLKPWIALIERGNCEFRIKILNAKALNASAVVIFDNVSSGLDHDTTMTCYAVGDIVAVSIAKDFGQRLASKVETARVHLKIDVGDVHYQRKREWQVGGKTSVLFVLVSFILLMCISLAWLVFYYVQRFRYFYARDKKEKQLMNAAKKAISKLKTRTCDGPEVKEEQEETCAVCLEGYKNGETLRILSCRHEFHKICVDPWLLEHRTCPICKTNILKALGLAVADVGSSDIDLENVTPEPNQVAYASEELEPQADTSNRAEADSKASSYAEDEEQCSFSRSITVNSSGSSSADDDESSINSTSVLVAQGYA